MWAGTPEALPHDLMAMLAESKTLAPRVKSFMEAPLTYLHIQDRGFHFDMLDSLPALFPVADPALVQEVASGAHRFPVCLGSGTFDGLWSRTSCHAMMDRGAHNFSG